MIPIAILSTILAAVGTAAGYEPASTAQTDALAAAALANLKAYAASQPASPTCNFDTAIQRREWSDLTPEERTAYTDAVRCLMSKPARFLDAEGTGIKTRYDDFVAIHMNQTLTVHGTANFLSWHRYLVWTYENALRDECGYPGYQPYWNWAKYALDPINSPLFDGSSTSMSGNGAYEAHNCTDALGTGVNCIPPGIGGGCVESGPFAGITINLGPVAPTLAEPEEIAVTNMFDWNPRCLKRDISPWVSSQWTTDQNITDVINQNLNIVDFQYNLQGGDFSTGDYGVHAGGHYTLGGADPGGDIFVSPGDPVFWLHHAAIDRTWWIWQNQDPVTRTSALGGTITMYNSPASRNGTLEDILDMGVNGPSSAIGPVMSTIGLTGGPLCYIYV